MIGIEVRTKKLEDALFRLSQAGNVDFGKVIKQEAAYVLRQLIKFTPPPDRPSGQYDVMSDMRLLSNPLSYDYFKSRENTTGFYRSMSRYIRRRNTEKLNQLFQIPQFTGFFGKRMIDSIPKLAQAHRASQNQFGRIKQVYPFATYASDYKKYLKDVQARVGWTINGWIPTAKVCGAAYPKWAGKLKPIKYARTQLSGDVRWGFGKNPFITGINYNVKLPNYENRIKAALSSRLLFTERKLERVLAGKAVNLGFVRVKGGQPVSE